MFYKDYWSVQQIKQTFNNCQNTRLLNRQKTALFYFFNACTVEEVASNSTLNFHGFHELKPETLLVKHTVLYQIGSRSLGNQTYLGQVQIWILAYPYLECFFSTFTVPHIVLFKYLTLLSGYINIPLPPHGVK